MRALHPVLRADLGRPVHRAGRARRAAAGRLLRRSPLRLVLLGQRDPDLPGRRAHERGLPLPGASVRPGQHHDRVRALRVRVRTPHRSSALPGQASPCRQRPRGQRGVELRQGTLRVPLLPRGRSRHDAPRAPRGLARTRVLARGHRRSSHRSQGGRLVRGRADRRAPHARDGLRLQPLRPCRARYQPHRLPVASALGRGSRLPGCLRRGQAAGPLCHLRGDRACQAGAARQLRTRGRVSDRLPPPPQGRPQAQAPGGHAGALPEPRFGQAGRPLGAHSPGSRGAGARRPGQRRRRIHRRRRHPHPRGGARRRFPGLPHRGHEARGGDRCEVRLGPASSR